MAEWTILDFVDAAGMNQIRSWIDSLPRAAQAKIDTRLRFLEISGVWPPQYVSDRKDCPGIYELRIACSGVQYRPLGFYGPRRREFTLLLGAVEKGGRLEPRDFCRSVLRRKELVNGDRNRIVLHRYG
jgi:hypothetical protein